MIIADLEILNNLTCETSEKLLEMAKILKDRAKYVVVESVSTFDNMLEGLLNTKQVFNVLDNEEIGNMIPIPALLMNQDLGEGITAKINVKFYDIEPKVFITTQE